MPAHHPDSDLLAGYASGACDEATGVVIASHLSLCSACAAACDALEGLGGALLESLPAARLSDGALERAIAALDEAPPERREAASVPDAVFPAPLRRYLGFGAHQTPWRRVARGLSVVRVGEPRGAAQLRLMRIEAGTRMPAHDHGGRELTLVLSGGFSDENGHYLRGDIADLGIGVTHSPRADTDADCVCLALNEGAIRPSSLLGRMLTPFLRF